MNFYRIKESYGGFIPQVCEGFLGLINGTWKGIDADLKTFYREELQMVKCKYSTIDEARSIIKKHKPKYHKA